MTILAQPLVADGPHFDRAADYYRQLHDLADARRAATPRPSSSATRSACPSATAISSMPAARPCASLADSTAPDARRVACSLR